MPKAWSPELVVTTALGRSLIEAQFPSLIPARVEPLGAGWDNTALRVNVAYVFRFPRRQCTVPFLESEIRVLPALAPRLPMPISAPIFIGRPTDQFPWPFAGYPMIPGRTACGAALNDAQRAAVAEPLARFLATLHAIRVPEASGLGARLDTIPRLDLARHVPQAREILNQIANRCLIEDPRPFAAILDAAPAAYAPREDCLVHGDLYVRHLLVHSDNQLAGVIDWGDVHLGDPAADLMIAHAFLPPLAHEAFRKAYGPVDSITWHIARLRALWHSATVLTYGHDIGDTDLVRESQMALRYLALAQSPS